MTNKFRRRGPRLYAPNGTPVTFPHPIEHLLDYGSVAVVLLDPAGETRNVYGVDRRGKTVWRLRQSPLNSRERSDPYVGLFRLGRSVRVFSFRGQIYDADPRTGKVLGSGWAK